MLRTLLEYGDMSDTPYCRQGGWQLDFRDPTYDRQVVEFCLTVPLEEFLRGRPTALPGAAGHGGPAAGQHAEPEATGPSIRGLVREYGCGPRAGWRRRWSGCRALRWRAACLIWPACAR